MIRNSKDCGIYCFLSDYGCESTFHMSTKQLFKRHRFPAVITLCAVRMYLRYPLSYKDVTDLLAERGLA